MAAVLFGYACVLGCVESLTPLFTVNSLLANVEPARELIAFEFVYFFVEFG